MGTNWFDPFDKLEAEDDADLAKAPKAADNVALAPAGTYQGPVYFFGGAFMRTHATSPVGVAGWPTAPVVTYTETTVSTNTVELPTWSSWSKAYDSFFDFELPPEQLTEGEFICEGDVYEDGDGRYRSAVSTVGHCVPEGCTRYWQDREATAAEDAYLETRLWQKDAGIES